MPTFSQARLEIGQVTNSEKNYDNIIIDIKNLIKNTLPVDKILMGDCVEALKLLPDKSIDLIFADPPYNLQLQTELLRPNQTVVDGVDDEWDKFTSTDEYDLFTKNWLTECKRVLKSSGTIWVIGSYHNIFRVGKIMADLGYWTINDVIWYKTNPMPNFKGTRFTNATETLIWAMVSKEQKSYTFNYHTMKSINEDKQMTNVWHLPLCTGPERIKIDGEKAHSTQKPEAILYRVILSSSNEDQVVLDPFLGSGTTAAVAKKLGRRFLGIEIHAPYTQVAAARIEAVTRIPDGRLLVTPSKRTQPRVAFSTLIESGYLSIGQEIYNKGRTKKALIHADGSLVLDTVKGSIHKVAAYCMGQMNFNGWEYWYVDLDNKKLISINSVRSQYLEDNNMSGEFSDLS